MANFYEGTLKPLSLRIFEKYDLDNSGYITISEFAHMIEDHGLHLNAGELEIAMLTLDYDGNGRISYEEFLSWKKKSSFQDLRLDDVAIQRRKTFLDLFRKYDLDSNGSISADEFVGLYEDLKEAEVVSHDRTSTYEDMDSNSDGVIEYSELVFWLEKEFVKLGYM
mmetsp:Transcript_19764/g.27173  ORF Transcript_19764/g.27173 Transcript_19764/m.27173 type:complete len:166 (+) Transcript_19764:199-696(+)